MKSLRWRPAAAVTLLCTLGLAPSLFGGTYATDFTTDPTNPALPANQRLTIYSNAQASAGWVATGGNPGGYLRLTDAVNSARATVIFPDFEQGFVVKAFHFEVDCRIGGGSATPADGFSINFARSNDDVLDDGEGFSSSPGGEANLPEEGTKTGLAIGFDVYDSGSGDVVGFSVKLDNNTLVQVPAETRNGTVDDPTSLQTGPLDGNGTANLGWARFAVDLREDGTLDVVWKGVKVVDNLVTGFTPSPGRLVFAARTGGLNEAHHFDNLSLTTTAATVAGVTRSQLSPDGYIFEITDFGSGSVVTPADIVSLTIDGVSVTPTSTSKTGSVTTVTYDPPVEPDPVSEHTFTLTAEDQNGNPIVGTGTVTAPYLPASLTFNPPLTEGIWEMREVRDGPIDPFTLGRAAVMAQDPSNFFDGSAPFINHSDPDNSGDRGLFKRDLTILSNTPAVDDNDIILLGKTIVSVPAAGDYTFWVQSDDGFALRVAGGQFTEKQGNGAIDQGDPSTIGFLAGTGNSDTRAVFHFDTAGPHVVEFVGFEGGVSAFWEVAWTEGAFATNPGATSWRLVGGAGEMPVLPTPLPPSPTGTALGWGMRELRGNHGGTLVGAVANAAAGVGAITDGSAPVINHNDLDGVPGTFGFFNNDLPFIGNQPGDDNDVIVVARLPVTFAAAGMYTLGVIADDGFALRVPGAHFVGTAGPGGLDPLDSDTLFNPNYNAEQTLGVLNVPAPGLYEVFFLAQETAGGASWEVFGAPGDHRRLGSTSDWQLLGNPAAAPAPTPVLPAELAGPGGQDGQWGLRFVRGAGNMDNLTLAVTALQTAPGGFTDATAPYLNFADVNGTPGGRGLFRDDNADNGGNYQVAEMEFPGDAGGEDDHVAAVARATLVIPTTGSWTFGVHSDDGFALRIDGALFTRVSGGSRIDPADKSTVYFPDGTGDSNARAVTQLTAGEHEVEFVWFEGVGGAFFELYAAEGAFNEDADTGAWRLVGGPGGLQIVATAPGEAPITDFTFDPLTRNFSLTFQSSPGTGYTIQYSTTLAEGSWQDWTDVTGDAGETTTITGNAALVVGPLAPMAFFRVVLQ